jgi:hypothetical protein
VATFLFYDAVSSFPESQDKTRSRATKTVLRLLGEVARFFAVVWPNCRPVEKIMENFAEFWQLNFQELGSIDFNLA